jgi:aerobic carbon-monoxide dehydrogenase large subunit
MNVDQVPRLEAQPRFIGAAVGRLEDDRLLRGLGRFVGDLQMPGLLDVCFVRSREPHARIDAIDASAADRSPGVHLVVTAADLVDVAPFPDFVTYMQPVGTFPLVRERARYVGAPLAAVVADNRYLAEDAAELVSVGYETLPPIADVGMALRDEAIRLFDSWPDNRIVTLPEQKDTVDAAFDNAHRVVSGRFSVQRHTGVPMEPRGCLAEFGGDRLTLWSSTQSPHIVRTTLSYVLQMQESDIRVIAPDVGGGFGCKSHVYSEEAVVAWLARKLQRPVRYLEDRAEHLVATNHAREHVLELEGAVAETGEILALRCHLIHDVGSGEIFFPGVCPTLVSSGIIAGPYRIPEVAVSITEVVTNKTPSGAFRGFGLPEATFAIERFVELVAEEVGVDPIDLRRRMLIRDEDLPFTTARGGMLDSGSFHEALEQAVILGRAAFERQRTETVNPTVRVGLGIACYIESTAPTYFGATGHWTSQDAASIHVEPDGSVIVDVGVTTQGQGVTTMVATVAADAFGVDRSTVSVRSGDTDISPYGLGAWGSRSTVVGGGAVLKAATKVRHKALRIAAHVLETAPEDLEFRGGRIVVRGSEDTSIPLAEVAMIANVRTDRLPPGIEPGLQAAATYDPPTIQHWPDDQGKMNGAAAWTNATHAAVVGVDVDTGTVEVLDYVVVHDCGTLVNPPIVEGQIHGGVAHGIGGALYEHLSYTDDAQPLATTFMDYLIPTSEEIPSIHVEHFESPSPSTPLGAKGVGEGGAIGPPAAIANAVANALRDLDVRVDETPITPGRVRARLRATPSLEP